MRYLLVALCAFALACGGTRAAPPGSPAAPVVDPVAAPGSLSRFAADAAVVFPVQGIALGDPVGWRAALGPEQAFLARMDSLLEAAHRDRGLVQWTYAPTLQRAARRNPTYLVDPTKLRAAGGLRAAARQTERAIGEPLASQLRALAAVPGARYAIVPMEVRFTGDVSRSDAALRLTMAAVDVRTARLLWMGEVASPGAASYTPALVDQLLQRAADLVVPR